MAYMGALHEGPRCGMPASGGGNQLLILQHTFRDDHVKKA